MLKNNIARENITMEDILKISEEDLSQILTEMHKPKVSETIEKYKQHKGIVKLHGNVAAKTGEITEATQYDEAINDLTNLVEEIESFIKKYRTEKANHLESLSSNSNKYKNFYNKFKGGKLSEPILADMPEFLDLIKKLGFNLAVRVSILIAVGKENVNLVQKNNEKEHENTEFLGKYRVVLKEKKEAYKNTYQLIVRHLKEKKVTLDFEKLVDQIKSISKELPKINIEEIQNILVCLLLEEEIYKCDQMIQEQKEIDIETKNSITVVCEKLLKFSRQDLNMLKEETKQEDEPKEQKEKIEDEFIESVKKIVEENTEYLHSYSTNDTKRFSVISKALEQSAFEDNVEKKDEISYAFILETLRSDLKMYENIKSLYEKSEKEYEFEYKKISSEIKENFETYKILNKRIEKENKNLEENKPKKLIKKNKNLKRIA